jgi:hypothetical protein
MIEDVTGFILSEQKHDGREDRADPPYGAIKELYQRRVGGQIKIPSH